MQFLSTLPILLLPTLILSSPNPAPIPSDLTRSPVLTEHQLDLSNLTGLLDSLTGSIQTIETLLSPTSLNNIEAVVTDLANLLGNGTASDTKGLITTASSLLTGNLINKIEGLLTPALISNITDILGNGHDLLTADFVGETKILIGDVAPLLK